MNILLINENPVVSRLLQLCTRNDTVRLDEISHVNDISQESYDMILVDESAYKGDVINLMQKYVHTRKVFISYSDTEKEGFTQTLKKPFLPSEISELIHTTPPLIEEVTKETPLNVDEDEMALTPDELDDTLEEVIETQEELPAIFNSEDISTLETEVEHEDNPNVLDKGEIDKIKNLLEMDEEIEVVDTSLSDDEIEVRKIEAIKEQLIADGLEIVEEDKIVEELSVTLDGTLKKSEDILLEDKTKSNNKLRIKKAIKVAIDSLSKKQKKKLLKGDEITLRVKLEEQN